MNIPNDGERLDGHGHAALVAEVERLRTLLEGERAAVASLRREVDRQARILKLAGVCASCDGSGYGAPDYVEHVAIPTACPECAGAGFDVFFRGKDWAEGYYRSISGCPKEKPLYDHILELAGVPALLADRAQRARDRGAYDVEGALRGVERLIEPASPSSSAKAIPLHELGTTEPPAPATCTVDGAVARRPPATFGEKVLAFGLAEPSGIMGDAFARAAGREPCATCGAPHPPPPAPVIPARRDVWPKGTPICTCIDRAWTRDAGAYCVPCTKCGGLRPAPQAAITDVPFAGRRDVFASIAHRAQNHVEKHRRPPRGMPVHDYDLAFAFELLEELARELAGKEMAP